mmetsp:Transcript_24796/g.52577  ORF Transcript_24796/g.52577 Transcript_24796/m.52577 type:complete len:374 (+) Transcript_24796:1772-2893(+)
MDRDCAFFVRDALFPLRRDWGSANQRHHSQIHPALNALDRLRTDLVDKRPKTMSYSNVFPRGVLLVAKSDALGKDNDNDTNTNNHNHNHEAAIEYNGQPDVDESNATVEVVPNILTVKCMQCNKFRPSSSVSSESSAASPPPPPATAAAFVRTITNPYSTKDDDKTQHELVLCSDRVLQKDYHHHSRTKNNNNIGSGRREDLPAGSLKMVEEILSREITKLMVNSDSNNSNSEGTAKTKTAAVTHSSWKEASSSSQKACQEYAARELLAARAAECLLVRTKDEVRMGSALRPSSSFLFSLLPSSIQRNFVDRCVRSVATQCTVEVTASVAVASANNQHQRGLLPDGTTIAPKECVKRAWENANRRDGGKETMQ